MKTVQSFRADDGTLYTTRTEAVRAELENLLAEHNLFDRMGHQVAAALAEDPKLRAQFNRILDQLK